MTTRKRYIAAGYLALFAAASATAIVAWRDGDWRPFEVFVLLLAIAVVSDAFPLEFRQIRISGSFLAIVLAATLMGPAPAVAIGLTTVVADAVRTRMVGYGVAVNLGIYSVFPLAGGLAMRAVEAQVALQGVYLALVVLGFFLVLNLVNFLMVAVAVNAYMGNQEKRTFRSAFLPVLPAEFATGLLTAAIAVSYREFGAAVLGLLTVVGLVFQILLRTTFESVERGEQLERRTTELASLQVGLLSTVLQTLSLRDRMTARHSAAVARYAREMAKELGLSEREQDLIHTAGLLHDIGKFIFPDSILFADRKLSDEDFVIIKRHPEQGAKLVRRIEGYGPVAEIIHAHHERIDGKGYPRGLLPPEIPLGSRIISIADTYDVMTSRDSYRSPVSSAEAIAELRRVSGTQLDGELVECFIKLVERRSIAFRHADDADFEAELSFERRVRDYAQPVAG
ncbi:MAG TPA: HD-GYP domain-containing protein [Solirubrobacteraceae bacterium]